MSVNSYFGSQRPAQKLLKNLATRLIWSVPRTRDCRVLKVPGRKKQASSRRESAEGAFSSIPKDPHRNGNQAYSQSLTLRVRL